MLWAIFVILVVMWLFGLVSSYTLGGYIAIAGDRGTVDSCYSGAKDGVVVGSEQLAGDRCIFGNIFKLARLTNSVVWLSAGSVVFLLQFRREGTRLAQFPLGRFSFRVNSIKRNSAYVSLLFQLPATGVRPRYRDISAALHS
jgi:hypothetical protein